MPGFNTSMKSFCDITSSGPGIFSTNLILEASVVPAFFGLRLDPEEVRIVGESIQFVREADGFVDIPEYALARRVVAVVSLPGYPSELIADASGDSMRPLQRRRPKRQESELGVKLKARIE